MHLRHPAVLAAALIALAGCGRQATNDAASGSGAPKQSAAADQQLSPTTPAAKGPTGPVTWATYREVQTLDPIQAFDYPENTVIYSMCESLLQQQPDGTIKAGIASVEQPDPTTIVFTINPDAKFWDGKAVTADDVVYSLKRNTNKALAGFYGAVFTNVSSIAATGAEQVTIKLSKHDNWLLGELAALPGLVLEKAYVESKGKSFGTPSGGTMCTGPFKLGSWKPGTSLTAVRNDAYWDSAHKAQAESMVFKGVPDDASLTTGLLTNEITGTYPQPLTTLDQLKASKKLKVAAGPSFASDALVISSLKGTLKDVKVRQALSMAIDRKAYIDSLYKGYALLPRTLGNPGTWGFERDVFQADWDKLPEPKLDVAKATQMIKDAGAAGQELVIGTSNEINSLLTAANAIRQAAVSIGLKARLKSVSAANYINFFTDPKARADVDGFITVNYPDYADPAALYNTVVMPDGSQNYDGFSDARITAAMNEARTVTDQTKRAQATAKAGDLIMETLPWIPLAAPNAVLIMDSRITGAPSSFQYMGGPWASPIGAAG